MFTCVAIDVYQVSSGFVVVSLSYICKNMPTKALSEIHDIT